MEVFQGKETDHRFDVFSLGVMVVVAALGRRIFDSTCQTRASADVQALEDWLKPLRDAGTGDITWQRLKDAPGRFAADIKGLIDTLGDQVTHFVLNRMLTGNREKRATMAEVAEFCEQSIRLGVIDRHRIDRAAMLFEDFAAADTHRLALMEGLIRFDKRFPPGAPASAPSGAGGT